MAEAISRGQYGRRLAGWQAFAAAFIFFRQINSCFSILGYQKSMFMLCEQKLLQLAPSSFKDWLRQRVIVRNLQSLLQRLRRATPAGAAIPPVMQTVISEIASAEAVERQAFHSILEIEAAYEAAKRERRLRQATQQQAADSYARPAHPQESSLWLLFFLSFWQRKPNKV